MITGKVMIAIVEALPFPLPLRYIHFYSDLHIDAEAKYSYQLTKHLLSFVNATVTFSIVPTWGYLNKTSGNWTGMIGQLLRNEADIGATGLFFTTERIPIIEYISHSSTANAVFIFLSPKLSYTNNLYILPFDKLLWICLLILVLVLALWLVAAIVFESKHIPHPHVRFVSIVIDLRFKSLSDHRLHAA